MASSKQRTTFAKLNRENKLLRKREEKAARKAARKLAAAREADEDAIAGSEPAGETPQDAQRDADE